MSPTACNMKEILQKIVDITTSSNDNKIYRVIDKLCRRDITTNFKLLFNDVRMDDKRRKMLFLYFLYTYSGNNHVKIGYITDSMSRNFIIEVLKEMPDMYENEHVVKLLLHLIPDKTKLLQYDEIKNSWIEKYI